ncbi:MAG: hypothetical protein KGI54_16950 [Pseudomonadota bacterium]|nr:hypothetical protein [Pseudomonadota bacterium]
MKQQRFHLPIPVWQQPVPVNLNRRVTDQKEPSAPVPAEKSGNLLPLPIDSEGGHCD